MDLTADELAVWALGAAEPDELARLDRAVTATSDGASRETAAAFIAAVGVLGETLAAPPPPALRDRILRSVEGRDGGTVISPVEVYGAQVDTLAALLDELSGTDWQAPTGWYPWTVHELVAHLLVVEEYTAALLGVPGLPRPGHAADHLALGAERRAEEVAGAPPSTVRHWLAATELVRTHAQTLPPTRLDEVVVFHDLAMSAGTMLVVRAFELWTHADDIRSALGRQRLEPRAEHIRTMADRSVQALPVLVGLSDQPVPDARARVVLTGRGGGVWDLALGEPAGSVEPTLLVADAVDYCRMVARRLSPDELDVAVEGDAELARRLLDAASAVAV